MLGDQDALQGNAADPEQGKDARQSEHDRERRRRGLFRSLMNGSLSAADGRELLAWLLLERGSVLGAIAGTPEQVQQSVALHNDAVDLLTAYVLPHQELWRQTLTEAFARAEHEKRTREARQAARESRRQRKHGADT